MLFRSVHHANYVHFGPEEVLLHVAPLAFDASTFEIWGSLLNGGKLAILPSEHPSLNEVAATIQSCGVTTAFLTAGLFHLIADRSMPAIQTMRQLVAGGDVVSASHAQRFLATADEATFVNGYGPTEIGSGSVAIAASATGASASSATIADTPACPRT